MTDPGANPGPADDLEETVAVFTSVRPRLFGIAYRMLSSAAEAEDLVQEVWVRWQTCDRSVVVSPAAFLATTTTRLAINALQSARVRRETYVGPWDVVRELAEACRRGDVVAVRAALAADAVAVCDGGGVVPAATGAIHGAEDVAQLVSALLCGQPDTELTIESVNGRAGLALRRAGRALAVVGVQETGAKVTALWIVLNPAKLRGWHR